MDTSGYITDNNIENIDEMREKADNYFDGSRTDL